MKASIDMYTLTQWLMIFFIYCFIGWIWECCYVSAKKKQWINRGFLHGPLLPIYGSGAIIILFCTIPVRFSIPLTFIFGMVSASILEFCTGWCMERLFGVRYWDYSDKKFNLQGHICLRVSIGWGVASVVLVNFLNIPVEYLIRLIPIKITDAVAFVITVLFVVDFTQSFNEAMDLKDTLEKWSHNNEQIRMLSEKINMMAAIAEEDLKKFKEQQTEKIRELAEQKDRLIEATGRQYKRIIRIMKRNPGAVDMKHTAEFSELKDTIKNKIRRGNAN